MKKSLILALMFLSVSALSKPNQKVDIIQETPDTHYYMTEKEFETAKKIAKRKVARVDAIDENVALSPEARLIRDAIIGGNSKATSTKIAIPAGIGPRGVETADQLAALINLLDNDELYSKRGPDGKILPPTEKTLPQDAQFVGAMLAAMKPFRGFTVRAKPMIDDFKFLHAMVVTVLRTANTGINVFAPTEQWRAGFKYVTEPYVGLKSSDYIKNDESFRAFVGGSVLQANSKLITRLSNMNFSEAPIFFDNKIGYATANFVADEDRFLQLGEAERHATLGAAFLAGSGIYSSISYSWKGLFKAMQNTMTKVYGFEQAFRVDGATAKRRTEVIREQNGDLFVKTSAARWAMPRAYLMLKEGFKNVEVSWHLLQRDQNNNNAFRNLLDPRAFVPFTRIIDTTLTNVKSIVRGDAVVSAVVAGETVRFDIQKFFGGDSSPKNLLDFLPTGFVEGCKEFTKTGNCANEVSQKTGISYRNYLEGSPSKWNMSIYNTYFPSIDAKDNAPDDKVRAAARVLSQSWGGWIIGVPLAGMVL